ncbi:hypothetical protein CcaCcLH18_13708 [Colletotrichum camelliae]|nr:hypothetical protein CcaCcLH18_13708 [Colletotrichum camelliae]
MNIYTFPLFSQLPRELRDMIWDCALRPFEHGAHHFSLEESSSRGPPNQHTPRALELCSIKSDENVSTYMLTRGLLTACEESRAAVERSRRRAPFTATPGSGETENTPRIITSKLDGRAQELFYYDSSDIIILRRGWGRTGHIVSDCLAIESDNGQSGASPHFPKHIGLEIDLDDFKLPLQWEYPPTNRGQQYEHFRCFVDSMMNWLNHGATLHFIGKLGSDYPCVQHIYQSYQQLSETHA